jgi:hypothetical protein
LGKSLQDWAEEYQYFSGKASEAIKTLALGGIAVIWLFHDDKLTPALEVIFIWPLTLLTLSLAFDLLHYVVGAVTWYRFYIHHEVNTPKDQCDDIAAPSWKRDVVSLFFYAKIVVLVVGYVWLSVVLFSKIF